MNSSLLFPSSWGYKDLPVPSPLYLKPPSPHNLVKHITHKKNSSLKELLSYKVGIYHFTSCLEMRKATNLNCEDYKNCIVLI